MNTSLAPPAQALCVGEWDDIEGGLRVFDGPEWRITYSCGRRRGADIVISVIGLQYADGHALREIVIDCPDTPIIPPAEARKLASALIAAADSAEGDFR